MGRERHVSLFFILFACGSVSEPQFGNGFEYTSPGGSPLYQDKVFYSTTPSPFDFDVDSPKYISSDSPFGSSSPPSFDGDQQDFGFQNNGPIIEITPRSYIGPSTPFPGSSTNFGPIEDVAEERGGFDHGPSYVPNTSPAFRSSRPTQNPFYVSSIRPTSSFHHRDHGRAIPGPTRNPYFLGENGNFLGGPQGLGFGSNFFENFGYGGNAQRQCPVLRPCLKSPFRTIDGTCNNLKNPWWGAARTPYGRLIAPKYADNNHAPPLSVNKQPLPEPRVLSRLFLPSAKKDDYKWTLATMQWGQIITHDMSLAMDTLPNPERPQCCNENGPLFNQLSKGEPCYPIVVPRDDPIFKKYGQTCMEFLRTTTDRMVGCPTGKGSKPLSEVTHWLDASLVYGSAEERARDLRLGQGGLLRVEIRNKQQWPTVLRNSTLSCARPAPEQVCYKTGDDRVNQNPQLALLQIVLHREHNRLATVLTKLNPHWDDERLYQEARRILIGEIQHISYYEWLPIVFGGKNLKGLVYFNDDTYVNDYDERINPSVLNEHAQGAFRFLHTNIQGELLLASDNRQSEGHINLPENMLDVSILETGAFDDLARGMTTQFQHATDRYHSIAVTQNLFRRPEAPNVGFDLKSLDIQRGRDHGLASYNTYREHCGYRKARSFADFSDLIHLEDIQRLEKVYSHPEDVDLGIGGALEGNGPEGAPGLGPTFSCIIKEQFLRSRIGDKFFYEHGNHPGAFTPAQLKEIRKSSIARLLCDNSEEIYTMQPRAFELLSPKNPLLPCEDFSSIPIVDLNAWRDTRKTRKRQSRTRY